MAGFPSLDEMLLEIAQKNHISHYRFAFIRSRIADYLERQSVDCGLIEARDVAVQQIQDQLPLLRTEARERDCMLGIVSLLPQAGDYHLFFLDCKWRFHDDPEKDESNLYRISEFIASRLVGPGYLLFSGKSYHYYSVQIETASQWQKKILETGFHNSAHFVDSRWLKLARRRGYGVLRISTTEKKPVLPCIVRTVPPEPRSFLE